MLNPPGSPKLVVRPGYPLNGEYCLPGDKSLSHRAALLAALAHGESHIENFLVAGVTRSMLNCLAELGVAWKLDGEHLWVDGRGIAGLRSSKKPLDCGNSATTLRLLAGALSAAGVTAVLDGSSGLRQRPMERIIVPLRRMGVEISGTRSSAPLELKDFARPLRAISYELPVASAQVKSCLLLAALAADGETVLSESGPSRDHTEHMLAHMGVKLVCRQLVDRGAVKYQTSLIPPDPFILPPVSYTVPGDFSSAAFLIVAGLITPGSEIILHKVGLNPTRTGLLEALQEMGADITISQSATELGEPVGDLTVRATRLACTQVSGSQVVRMIDEFPSLAVAACFGRGTTQVSQASELRLKESDRITQLCGELAKLGVKVNELPDGFAIRGGERPSGGTVHAHGDHRLAMSLAVLGLAGQAPITVHGAEMIGESFPQFIPALRSLGADLELVP